MRVKDNARKKRTIFGYVSLLLAGLTCFSLLVIFSASTAASRSLVIDDFEYWDSPYNHGWESSDYAYPVMGYGIGYGQIFTQLDFAEGSRVLTVHYQPSVFNRMEPYCLANYKLKDPETGQAPKTVGFSYKLKAPISFENFTHLRCFLLIKTSESGWLWLSYLPVEGKKVQDLGNFLPATPPPSELIPPGSSPIRCLGYPAGRELQDSTWHCLVRNLAKDLTQAVEEGLLPAPQTLEGIYGIVFLGDEYSVDEITLTDDLWRYENRHPFVWNPGPQFATLFEPFELVLYASDPENKKLSFHIQVDGWGIHGLPADRGFSLRELGPADFPDDPYLAAIPSIQRAMISFTPQYLEDLIVTVTVSDGYTNDITMFPLSVVNYRVQNHPPYIQRSGIISRFVAWVGEPFSYQVRAFDPDYDQLTYSAMINGLPSYQYGPWQEPLIDPHSGLIKFTPQFEGFFKLTVVVRDEKGAIGQAVWDLTIANRGAWLNHPPVRVLNIPSPQMVRAGELYTVATGFVDPDGDDLYYSTNIGAMTPDGTFSFLTYFPGQYQVSIIAYDFLGAHTYLNFLLDVQPWWSY